MVSWEIRSYTLHMSVYRKMLVGFLALFWVATPAQAEDQRAAFEMAIKGQIEALGRDDSAAAFGFASPDIQQTFETPERFMRMVRSSFKQVYRPRSYSFEDPVLVEGRPTQPVRFIGPDGFGVVALYRMEQQDDGSWRIGGVTLHPIEERGT